MQIYLSDQAIRAIALGYVVMKSTKQVTKKQVMEVAKDFETYIKSGFILPEESE